MNFLTCFHQKVVQQMMSEIHPFRGCIWESVSPMKVVLSHVYRESNEHADMDLQFFFSNNQNPIHQNKNDPKNNQNQNPKPQLTSPNLAPHLSLSPQKTHVSHKQGPSPRHMALQAKQQSFEELNLKSVPHFTAVPQSSKLSIP